MLTVRRTILAAAFLDPLHIRRVNLLNNLACRCRRAVVHAAKEIIRDPVAVTIDRRAENELT